MKIGDTLEVTQEYADWYGDNPFKVPVGTRCIVTAIRDTDVEARADTRVMPAIPLDIAQRMFVPTIADAWSAFLRLSAAWDDPQNPPVFMLLPDGRGSVRRTDFHEMWVCEWNTLADALTAIEAARAGLEG